MNRRKAFLAVVACALFSVSVIIGWSTIAQFRDCSRPRIQLWQRNSDGVTILFRTSYFGVQWFPTDADFPTCGRECKFTVDSGRFCDSDAVVFHANAMDFFPSLNQAAALSRPPNQRWVLFNSESPSNTPDLQSLNGLINWTINYMKESDIRHAYGVIKPGVFHGGFDPKRDYLAEKTEMAAILVSNCDPARLEWVDALKQYMDVKVYGVCGPNPCSRSNPDKCLAILRKHKFYLSFENSFCHDYVTEKLYGNALSNGIVPVVLSDVNFSDPTIIPPGAVINALDFPSVKELAEYMKKVGSNSTLYNNYFKWHSKYTVVTENAIWCALCKRLATDRRMRIYKDVGTWYSNERLCKEYPVPK